jgi:20S proteasome alpha/beta subunit
MTVVAGLVCSNGVVLAADTEITHADNWKTYESKIFPINRETGCYFAYTGTPDFAKELADRLRSKTKAKDDPDEITTVIKQEYQAMVGDQRKKLASDRTSAQVLVTVRRDVREPFKTKIHDYKTSLYQATEGNFFEVNDYAVLGIAEAQGTAIFKPLYSRYLSVRENVYRAIYAVQKVKRWLQGVGGETEIIEILNNDSRPFADFGKLEIKQIEDDFDFLEEQLKPLMIALPSTMNDAYFQATLDRFTKALQARHAKRLETENS